VDLLRAAGKENVLRIERDRQGAVRVFPGLSLMDRPRQVPMDGLPEDVDEDVERGNEALPAELVIDVVADLPIAEAQVDPFYADADDEPQPFAPEPEPTDVLNEVEEVEEEGPQPGNELKPSGGGRRRASQPSARPARGARASKTAKPRAPRPTSTSSAPRARKTTARGRGRTEE